MRGEGGREGVGRGREGGRELEDCRKEKRGRRDESMKGKERGKHA